MGYMLSLCSEIVEVAETVQVRSPVVSSSLCPSPDALVADSKVMRAVKLCTN